MCNGGPSPVPLCLPPARSTTRSAQHRHQPPPKPPHLQAHAPGPGGIGPLAASEVHQADLADLGVEGRAGDDRVWAVGRAGRSGGCPAREGGRQPMLEEPHLLRVQPSELVVAALREDDSEDSVRAAAGLVHVGGGHRPWGKGVVTAPGLSPAWPDSLSPCSSRWPHRALFPQSMRSAMSA